MRRGGRRTTWGARWARLPVLTLLLAGFLSMHGFLAVSSAEALQLPPTTAQEIVGPGHATGADTGRDGHEAPAGPGSHTPTDHHGVLAGCVVGLIGAALLTLALVSAARRRPSPAGRDDHLAPTAHRVLRSVPVGGPLPRFGLCVIRV